MPESLGQGVVPYCPTVSRPLLSAGEMDSSVSVPLQTPTSLFLFLIYLRASPQSPAILVRPMDQS